MGLKAADGRGGAAGYGTFQSPCGEMGLKAEYAQLDFRQLTFAMFQSPCGEMGLKGTASNGETLWNVDGFSPLAGKWV